MQLAPFAVLRAWFRAGISMAARIVMIAITTSSSMRVNRRGGGRRDGTREKIKLLMELICDRFGFHGGCSFLAFVKESTDLTDQLHDNHIIL